MNIHERTDPRCNPNRDFPYAEQDGDDCIHVCCLCGQERFRSVIYDESEDGPWLHRCLRDDDRAFMACDDCMSNLFAGIAEAAARAMLIGEIEVRDDGGIWNRPNIEHYRIAARWLRDNGYIAFDETPEAWLEGK